VSKKQAPLASPKTSTSSSTPTPSLFSIAIHKNLLVMVVCLITIFVLQKQVIGYNWVWNTLIKENLAMQRKMPNLSEQQKSEAKMGYDITYMSYLVENTPKNAVILFPDPKEILNDSIPDQPKFRSTSGGIYTPLWVQYFAFPRKIVFANEKGKNPNYNKITHVAIVNYAGYEHIPYPVDTTNRLGILPIKLNN
jgi:hypothetical protein